MSAPSADRHRLRATFDEVPELYDRARPGYPDELFDDLVELARVPAGGRVLEIGPGTGQATLPLAVRLELFGRIRRRIELRLDSSVNKTYLAVLDVAERR